MSMSNHEKIGAYREIAAVLRKHSDLIEGTSLDVLGATEALIKYAELSELFGFEVTAAYSCEMAPLLGWLCLGPNSAHAIEKLILMGEAHGRTISWSDDGSQPDNEWLYCISFSTGAYYFGEHYPIDLFKVFWGELVELGPEYSDTANHQLYFSPTNARLARCEFHRIRDKYQAMVGEDLRRMKIEKTEKDLAALKAGEDV